MPANADEADFIPDELQWAFILIAGGKMPPGDLATMRAQAQNYLRFALAILTADDGLGQLIDNVTYNVGPEVGNYIREWGAGVTNGVGKDLAELANLQASRLFEQALNVEGGRYGIYIQVAWSAWEILTILANPLWWAWYPFVVANGRLVVRLIRQGVSQKTLSIIAGKIAREVSTDGLKKFTANVTTHGFDDIVKEAAEETGEKIAANTLPKVVAQNWTNITRRFVTETIEEAGEEVVEELAQGLLSQGIQMGQGNRREIDGKELGQSAALGAIGGAAGGLAHNIGDKTIKNSRYKGGINASTSGVVGEVVAGGAAVAPALGGAQPIEMLWGGINGAVQGAGKVLLDFLGCSAQPGRSQGRWITGVEG